MKNPYITDFSHANLCKEHFVPLQPKVCRVQQEWRINMNWNQLKYVLTIAEEKNISKAARKLYISQPSLSISLNQLEKETGSLLFERTGSTMKLTYAGKLFCQWAEMVLYSQNMMKEELKDLNAETGGRIVLGISPHRSAVLTPAVVKAIHQQYPDCEIEIVEKPNNELTVLLAEDKLDMIIDIPRGDDLTYESEIIVDEEICLAIPERFVRQLQLEQEDPYKTEHISSPQDANQKMLYRKVDLRLLKDIPFILLPEESYFGRMSRKCLKEAGIFPNVICECTFSETAKKLVESGLGVAFLPDILADYHNHGQSSRELEKVEGVEYFYIQGSDVSRTIAVVYKKDQYHSEQFKRIVQIFKNCFKEVYELHRGECR